MFRDPSSTQARCRGKVDGSGNGCRDVDHVSVFFVGYHAPAAIMCQRGKNASFTRCGIRLFWVVARVEMCVVAMDV